MPTVRGRAQVKAYMGRIPAELEDKVLRGAARAAARVVADDAKDRSISTEVSAAIKVATKRETGRVIGKVQVKGPGAYKASWLEYGTEGHFISVDESVRDGMSIGRINRLAREGSLVIAGHFVGSTVWHPGAQPHPFLRPALDLNEAEALAAAQSYINTRITPGGIVGTDEGDAE